MAYTNIDKSSLHFNTKLYTGTGSSNAITGVGFQPDWVWIKRRSATSSNQLFDAVRGVTKRLFSDSNEAESTSATTLTSFDSDGFTVSTHTGLNGSSDTYAAWNWLANGSGSANTDGSISSTVSASTTSGFSIVKYTGNLTSGANIGHGLGVKPAMIIIKNLDATESWLCYHTSLGATKHIKLNVTEAAGTATSRFNDTEPTTSLFTVGNDPQTNGNSNDMIAYCFAEKKGFSKFGSYTGNGNADGAFIYTGFKPGWIMIKRYDSGTEDWNIWDSKRIGYNISGNDKLYANLNSAELTTENAIDILSNGFKLRSTNGGFNGSGSSYIYMAFAEAPLVGSNNVPCTAR